MATVTGVSSPKVVEPMMYPPTDEELRQKALTFLKENKLAAYRQLLKSYDLEATLALRVKMCRETAAELIASGEFENQAWNRAIRQDLLESETD